VYTCEPEPQLGNLFLLKSACAMWCAKWQLATIPFYCHLHTSQKTASMLLFYCYLHASWLPFASFRSIHTFHHHTCLALPPAQVHIKNIWHPSSFTAICMQSTHWQLSRVFPPFFSRISSFTHLSVLRNSFAECAPCWTSDTDTVWGRRS